MRTETLLDLAEKWERRKDNEMVQDGSPDAAVGNAKDDGVRQGKNQCALELRTLISLMED